MAGTHASGRRREKRLVIEECEKCDARDFGSVTRTTPTGEQFEIGKCPECDHGAKIVFRAPDGNRWRCSRCCARAGIHYRSVNERNSTADRVRRNPKFVKLATKAANNFLKTDDQKQLSNAMTILSNVPQSEFDELDEVQKYIVRDDIARLSKLMEHVEAEIYSGVENHTNRKGESGEIPLRADSFAKLGNLFIAASTARAARAGIAEKLRIETRATEGIGGKSMADILLEEARASDWKMQNGQTIDEFEAHREQLRALPEPSLKSSNE